ncbi:mucin-19 [Sceloporus undulatus]|uniref:mucin-19 n=1 Tax=Sceloporus undulatus TaxID=8520 RepID=UPI001C4BB909|nr:mucin-19 [Sceloporus undulatus]
MAILVPSSGIQWTCPRDLYPESQDANDFNEGIFPGLVSLVDLQLLKSDESEKNTVPEGFINTGHIDIPESDETEEDAASEGFINTGRIHTSESDEMEEDATSKEPLQSDETGGNTETEGKSRSSKTSKKPHSDKPQHVPDSTPQYSKKDTDVHPDEASTWGKGLFKTFGSYMFNFKSFCNFTFCRHCVESGREFNIEMSRNKDGKIDQISIVLDGNGIVVKTGKILVNHRYVQVPYDNKMIHIKKYGDYTKLESRRGILTLLWNDEDKLSIILHKKYDTCGLCGSHHAGRGIDVMKLIRDSKIPDTTCPEPVMEQSLHCGEGEMYCRGIISKYFKSCKNIGNQNHEYERLCTEEYCKTGSKMDVCSTFLELARICSSGGSGPFEAWRKDPDVVCVIPTCPESAIYRDCGPSNQATCSYMSPYQDTGCVSGCVCPEGYVLDDIGGNGKCIEKTKCACQFNGKVYRSGETRKGPCNSECTCQDAKWACTQSLCPGRCAVEGPFITTFDGTSYTYAGDCHFIAIQHNSWSLSVELRHCHTGPAETCLKSVTLGLGLPLSADKYIFHSNGSFFNHKIKHEDYYASDTIIIFKRSSSYIEAELYFGLKIQIQLVPTMQLYATLPAGKYGSTRGLCGSFNNNAEDDFMSSQNILEVTPETFAKSWEIMTCPKARHPSCTSIEKEKFAKENCAILTDPNGVFAAGHFTVDYRSYYEKCLISTCVCEEIKDCLCTALGNYVKACAKHGVYITDWRTGICEQNCEEGKVFQYNAKACNTSCRSFSEKDLSCDVEGSPVDGCICPEGLYKNSKGMCVKQNICDCYVDDKVLMTGQRITLENYTWYKPDSVNHMTDMPCTPGCYCPLGMVRDSQGQCIPPSRCPCSYSGQKYEQGRKINVECNTCTCVEGSWKCTAEKCQSYCHIYGDGQIQTFDGKWYSYDGFCQYVLAEDYCGKEDGSFRVLTESIPCCEDGVTCSRKITMILEGGTLVLEDGKFMFTKDSGNTKCTGEKPFTVHTVGLYLIIRYIHGITLIWDKNTRVSIIMDSLWNKQICGLCGNHNGNLQDEFTTRLGTLAAGPVEFGNSWKTIPMCSDIPAESFPCDANAYCKNWAVRKCEIIRDHRFRECHNKIDPTPYHKACIEEACVCTMEGKYHGFCTAVSMYAEACASVGICISWRTPELCPVFCDYYNAPGECSWHYEPCGSVTTKTCKDQTSGRSLPSVLEGCYAKCPEHAPYLDENTMKCVRLSECTCYHNEVVFPGEFIYDECGRQCFCRSGEFECSDLPIIPRMGEASKLKTDVATISTTASTSAMATHMIGTGRKEEETSGFIDSTSQTLQTKGFTEGESGTVGWDTGVPGDATEHVDNLAKTTTAMAGHDRSFTGVPPGTSMHITSSALKWNTGVTGRPTEHVLLRRSTEGKESVTAQTDGHDKPYTVVPSRTRRSITGSLVKQNTEYKKPTERATVRSLTEINKATTEYDKPYTEVSAGTNTDTISSSVTWNKDVTEHLRFQSSSGSTERDTRQTKQNTVGPRGTVAGVTKRNGGTENTANLGKTQKLMETSHYDTGPPRGRGSTVWETTKDTGIPITEYTEGGQEDFSTVADTTIRRRAGECPETPESTSCRFKSKYYMIGQTFKDPDNPCLEYTCTPEGFTTKVEECVGQSWCKNTSRVYRPNKCCYDCVNACRPVPMPVKIKINGCSDTVLMSMCSGECPKSLIYGEADRRLLNKCSCCQATAHVTRNIPVFCSNGRMEVYTYKHIISCSCESCKVPL